MERLTENVGNGVRLKECGNSICMAICNSKRDCSVCPIDEAFRKLADYEELEEQGLLVRLPCRVGDTVYKLWYYDGKPYKIQQHVIRTLSELFGIMESKKFGKSVFLTSEEAEKKLEELGNDKT